MPKIYKTVFVKYNPHEVGIMDIKVNVLDNYLAGKETEVNTYSFGYTPKKTYLKNKSIVEHENNNHLHIHQFRTTIKGLVKLIDEYYETMEGTLEDQYTTFRIPKASGGTRTITAPSDELKHLLSTITDQINYSYVLPHESAFAYIPKRSTKDAVQIHQANESKWFLKLDLKDFFPNSTKEFIIETLSNIYPFAYIDREDLEHVVEVSLYEGGLPQGSPLSPLLSNLIMVPFDHALAHELWDYKKQHYVYTRYADDIIISSKYDFNFKDIEKLVTKVLQKVNAPHEINNGKTRYGSSAGQNWNLGLMLNKDNDITIGYKKKQRMKATLYAFIKDTKEQNLWSLQEYQEFRGMFEYVRNVEPDYWKTRIKIVSDKLGFSLGQALAQYQSLL